MLGYGFGEIEKNNCDSRIYTYLGDMKDAEFEKTSDQWAAICVAVADTVKKIDISDDGGWVFPKEVTFKTHSLGFSNIGMPYYSKKQESVSE